MFSTPEYAFRRNKKITTVFRGEMTIWADREEAKNYILEAMMTSEGEDYERYSAIYIQLIHGMNYCFEYKNNYYKKGQLRLSCLKLFQNIFPIVSALIDKIEIFISIILFFRNL